MVVVVPGPGIVWSAWMVVTADQAVSLYLHIVELELAEIETFV